MNLRNPTCPKELSDMLILQVVAVGSIHGYAIAQRAAPDSRDVFQVQKNRGRFTRAASPRESRLLAAE